MNEDEIWGELMSKRKIVVIMVILLIITNVMTFGISQFVRVQGIAGAMGIDNSTFKIMEVRDFIENNYLRDIEDDKLLDGQLKGMVQSLEDPYSVYLTEEEYSSFTQETSGIYAGIGVIVTPGDDGYITIVSPIEDTPGERAGLRTGDRISHVDGVEYYGEEMDKAVNVMKGEANTQVTLTIVRGELSDSESFDVNITREQIRLVTVKSEMIDDIGYMRITSFDEITYEDFKTQLAEIENNNASGLIIDLRNNPGGLLNVTAEIADDLLGSGDIVYTETKDGYRQIMKSDGNQTDIPLVVLVNEGSASASEILSGAIKDHRRGEIIGTTTFGKGVVQTVRDLGDGSGIKLTVSQFFTPEGNVIHDVGVEPDIIVELNEDVETIGIENLAEDNQLQKALEIIREKIN